MRDERDEAYPSPGSYSAARLPELPPFSHDDRPFKKMRAESGYAALGDDLSMDEELSDSSELILPMLPASVPAKAKRPKAKGKGRKKADDDDGDGESDFEGKKAVKKARKPAGEKKKTSRACGACQKAHLTCDDARPCARCVKKGCPDLCQDGARKKAKYLQEVPDEMLERHASAPRPAPLPAPIDMSLPPDHYSHSPLPQSTGLAAAHEQPFSFDSNPFYDTNSFANEFGSEAANLEYAILSSMLNGNGFAVGGPSDGGFGATDGRLNGTSNGSTMLINSPLGPTLALQGIDGGSRPDGELSFNGSGPVASTSRNGYGPSIFDQRSPAASSSTHFGNINSPPRLHDAASSDLFHQVSAGLKSSANLAATASGYSRAAQAEDPNMPTMESSTEYPGRTAQSVRPLTSEEAYRTVTKPYPYAQGYHYLVRHLKERFEKNDILRIIRALAAFRPSLIALQMPLSEEDETFVERTFQRTLVELNKLISFSGTPTVVWRRTGEICLVGTEFCLLTGWSREELLGKKYIFELFDTASVVEYYESFAKHAFESTSSSVMTQCVVLGPSGRPVPCAFCFSVRRDLFSCPFLVIGSFLPVLV